MKRKGVSPVIATLLLIVIAVAAAVLTYIWVTGYMGALAPREAPTSMRERIKIDAVKINDTDIKIYVSNIGEIDTSIIGAYILYENYTAACGGPLDSDVDRGKGEIGIVTPPDCSLDRGTYIAKVSAKNGAEATYIFTKG